MCVVSPKMCMSGHGNWRNHATARLAHRLLQCLYEALEKEEQRNNQMGALASIRRRRFAPPKKAVSSDDGYTTPTRC